MAKWSAAAIPDLGGKTAIVTGVIQNLSIHTLPEPGHGPSATPACRERAGAAMEEMRQAVPHGDLGAAWNAAPIIPVDDAGVRGIPGSIVNDDIEPQFAVNYHIHFALTGRPPIARPVARDASGRAG